MLNHEKRLICLVRDLLFYSKIRAATALAGVTLTSIRDPAKLAGEIGVGLLVDLNQPAALAAAAEWARSSSRPVIGFVSHVDIETINTARAAGIDRVLARSQFEVNLPILLQELTG